MDKEIIKQTPQPKGGKLKTKVIILQVLVILALLGALFIMYKMWGKDKDDYTETIARYSQSLSDASYIVIYDNGVDRTKTSVRDDVPVNEYKKENLVTDKNGLKFYRDDSGNVISSVGIDVSYHQGKIYWDNVKAAGVEYAMLRGGYRAYGKTGEVLPDKRFDEYAQGALDAGIEIGAYFFSQAITPEEAREEAKFLIERVRDYNITYPLVYDWEEITNDTARTDGLTGEIITQCAIAFCEEIAAAGYTPMIYANIKDSIFRYDLSQLTDYDFWLAEYDSDVPSYIYDFRMWQYSCTGIIDGISTYVDLNICYDPYKK